MSITMKCVECKVTALNGIMEHTKGCSGYILTRDLSTDYFRPPATEIIFDSEVERVRFMKGLNTALGSVAYSAGADADRQTPPLNNTSVNNQINDFSLKI